MSSPLIIEVLADSLIILDAYVSATRLLRITTNTSDQTRSVMLFRQKPQMHPDTKESNAAPILIAINDVSFLNTFITVVDTISILLL